MAMYSDNLLERQRKIGKQLMMVNIIHVRNDREIRGCWPGLLSIDDLSEWSLIERDEIGDLVEATNCLYDSLMARDFSWELYSGSNDYKGNCLIFLKETMLNHGNNVLPNYDNEYITEYSIREADKNYIDYLRKYPGATDKKEYATPTMFRKILEYYVKNTVHSIGEVVADGYDWAVIKEMLRCDLTEEKYKELVELFGDSVEDTDKKEETSILQNS